MRRASTRTALIAVAASLAVAVGAGPALAHQHRRVGPFETTVGWANEPAYAGFQNAVSFRIEIPAAGAEAAPVGNAELQVEVFFGPSTEADERIGPMPLEAAFGDPGAYDAPLIPTRPGTYTFHVFGTVRGRDFDEVYTSGAAGANDDSEGTYNDVQEPDDIEFPVKDPSAGQLDDKIDAQLAAVSDEADSAGTKGLIGLILGAAGVLLGAAALVRSGRRT